MHRYKIIEARLYSSSKTITTICQIFFVLIGKIKYWKPKAEHHGLNVCVPLHDSQVLFPKLGNSRGEGGEDLEPAPNPEGRERPPKRSRPPPVAVGGSFSKRGNLPPRLVLSLTGSARLESSWSHRCNALSRLCPWKWLRLWSWWAERTFQARGRGWGTSKRPAPAPGSTCRHVVSMISFNSRSQTQLPMADSGRWGLWGSD